MNVKVMSVASCAAALAIMVMAGQGVAQPAAPNGEALYNGRCKSCHEPAMDRAPDRAALANRSPADIVAAMNGVMAPMAYGMTDADKLAIANFLSPPRSAPTAAAPGRGGAQPPAAGGRGGGRAAVQTVDTMCATHPAIKPGSADWLGSGNMLTNHRYQPNPGIRAADVPKLKVKWAFSLTQGNSQPAVVGDWLWIAGSGRLYALDAKTGCVHWRKDGVAARTTPIPVKSSIAKSGWALVVGQRNRIVKAFDAQSGDELWASEALETHRASGITGSPIVAGNQVFVPLTSGEEASGGQATYPCCSFRGSLAALDLTTGKKQWQTSMIDEPMKPIRPNASGTMLQGPAGAAIWSAPTVDMKRGLVYVATGDSYTDADTKGADAIKAVDMKTGKVRWENQVTEKDNFIMGCTGERIGPNCPTPLGPDHDFGASPILFKLPNGKEVVLSGQKSGDVHAMDPDTGKLLWTRNIGAGGALGGIEWGIAADDKRVFAGSADTVDQFSPATRANARPGLAAIDPATGKVIWHVPTPNDPCSIRSSRFPNGGCAVGNSAAPAVIPGVVFAGSTDGWFRAHDAATGKIVWKFNTTGQTYATTNGVPNQPGGGIDGNGPTVAAGTVFVTSGFDGASSFGSTGFGSNVLLAFTVDGK